METKYQEVPNIITGKDLDYLTDMFNWNLGCYKKTFNTLDKVENEEIKQLLEKSTTIFFNNTKKIINILGGTYE